MGKNPLTQVRINAARYELQTLRNNKQRLSNELYDIVLIRNFFKSFNGVINADGSNLSDAINAGIGSLPPDNEDTPRNEGISYEQFLDIIREQYGDMANDGINYEESQLFNEEYMDTHNRDQSSIGYKVRAIIAKQMQFDSQINGVNGEINDLVVISKSESQKI
ncbi:MAG: hypothetical protein A3B68_02715 [Candidatus Melainabacteria bacterium RIFCSPHIGHO2_02_FULL_34_12]|nr:MAG: hypothetical protein A3B68_02715 [Candidatus Melainabacteria bacterium RIFCSPHIGHO2_02_FULL_34_12]